MSRRVTVGLVGCGGWCKNYHVPLLTEAMSDQYQVVGVCDTVEELAREGADLTGAPAFAQVGELVAKTDAELVYIVTKPPATHHEVGREALEAGRHVFMEKPMCETVEQCDELIELARRHERLLAVHHSRRWEVPFMVAQRVVADGLVGRPYYVMSSHPSSWCGPADLLMDWGIHISDQALRIGAPAKPVEVSCVVRHVEEPETRSGPWRASVRFDNGLVVDLFQMLIAPGALPKWQVCGHEGSCTINPPFDVRNETGTLEVDLDAIQRGREVDDTPAFKLTLELVHYHEMLHRAIVDGAPLSVAPEGARNAVALSNLLIDAARAQRSLSVDSSVWINEN